MGKNLIIVESPVKARTLSKYLDKGFEVKASMGHVIDLPPKKLGVDLEKDFEPQYVTVRGKTKAIKDLKAAAANAICSRPRDNLSLIARQAHSL